MATNPYLDNPFTDLLDPEERLKQEMMKQQGPVMMQNVPDQGQGPTMMQGVPNQGAIQGQLTGQQQTQIDDVSSQPIRGMKAIMSADTPTWGTALAKTVAAGLTGHYGRKEQKKEKERLTKALQTDANKTETERVEDLAKEQRKAGLEERRMLAYEAQIEAQTNPEITPYQQGQLDLKADYYDYLKTKSENTARKPLTENQMAIRTEKLESKLDPLQSVVGAMTEVDNLLAPYAEGGAKAGGDIPGLGFIEGQRGLVGDLYRMTLGSEDARNIQLQCRAET